ncbi:peptidase [Clostridia bacterium]|nr:peptidase [Clostridia bacterium]
MNYTDLHCDTASKMYEKKQALSKNSLHIDMEKASVYERYSQVFAIWSDNDKSDDDNYDDFFRILKNLEIEFIFNEMKLCRNRDEYKNAPKHRAILGAEGGKLLGSDILRLDKLYESGVRILTLVWGGICAIGGAFDNGEGLTGFGREVVKRAEELGIIIDLSHSNTKIIDEVLSLTKKPLIASHSNSRSVFDHPRNLTDDHFKAIRDRGGVVGISPCRTHVSETPDIAAVLRHIEHYLELGGEHTITFGCDFDGCTLPDGFQNIEDILKLGQSEDIMYRNADAFFEKNL